MNKDYKILVPIAHLSFKITCLLLFLQVSLQAQDVPTELIWKIGDHDHKGSEFALAPNGFGNFIAEGFGSEDRYYVVGESDPFRDFPYLLPGPKDGFAGYGYYAGLGLHVLPIYFEIKELPKSGMCYLKVNILSASSSGAPLFRCTINGEVFELQLRAGNSETPENITSDLQQLVFEIPIPILKKGINGIYLQNMTGNWCAFDDIQFTGPSDLKVAPPGKTLVHSVTFADKEIKSEGNNHLPLMINLRHNGPKVQIRAVVDGVRMELPMEAGHSILEFEYPAVATNRYSEVQIYVDGVLKFWDKLERGPQEEIELSDYVDQFKGTSGSRWMIAPGPWMPMGMVKIAPDNEDSKWKAGYEYQIENIMGFSHVHEWTMAGLLTMPTNGPLRIHPGPENNPDLGYRSRIDKKTEKAGIGRYSVDLLDYGIRAELTATTRASMQLYQVPEDRENRILIDLHFPSEYVWELRDAEILKVSDTEIEGWALSHCSSTGYPGEQDYTLYFVIQLDRPISSMGGWVLDRIVENTDKIHKGTYEPHWGIGKSGNITRDAKSPIGDAGAFLNFPKGTREIKIRTGISLVSKDQARLNLEEEMVKPFGWDFESIVKNQKKVWNGLLGRIEIQTSDYLQKVKFYSNFYRALSPRNTWSDVNGKWVDMDGKIQQTSLDRPLYGSDAYWGTHWNLVPFYNLITPEFSSNWIHTFMEMYNKGGWLPRGNPGMEYFKVMPGEAAIPFMVSAYQHGIRDYDPLKMMEAIFHQQTALPESYPGGGEVGNESYKYYLERGYVPLNKENQSYVSNTMEYAYQDWCVAQLAMALEMDSIYLPFIKRSENWRNVFDVTTGFVRPRNLDGSWYTDFSPYYSPGFCESNSWQYSWYVPHNLPRLVDLMGKKKFMDKLDKGMEESEKVYFNALGDNFAKYPINHGNQSNMQSSYLFNHAGYPWLTQKWTRAIQEKYYGLGPRSAYPGDEDQGQMSSWFIMSVLGLFQMDGGASADPIYELGSPRFEKATIHLSDTYYGGNTFVIEARNASRENKYIHSAWLNGKKLETWHFPQKELIKGGKLELEMTDSPYKRAFKRN